MDKLGSDFRQLPASNGTPACASKNLLMDYKKWIFSKTTLNLKCHAFILQMGMYLDLSLTSNIVNAFYCDVQTGYCVQL